MRGLFLFFLPFALATSLWCNTETPPWLQTIVAKSQRLQKLSGRFIQTKTLTQLKTPLISQGNFTYLGAEGLHWVIEQPVQNHLHLTSRGSWRVDELGKKDRIKGFSQSFHKTLLEMFNIDYQKLQADFELTFNELENSHQLILTPKSDLTKKVLLQIELKFSNNALESVMLYHTQEGNTTHIQFNELVEVLNDP